jgi:hypothetical protein
MVFVGLSQLSGASSHAHGSWCCAGLKYLQAKQFYSQEDIMKAPKNFEGMFLAAVAVCSLAMVATAEEPVVSSAKPAIASSAPEMGKMQVVVVKAKRLTAAEKAASF